MLVNLIYGNKSHKVIGENVLNICPFDLGDEDIVICKVDKLNDYIFDFEAEEIRAVEVIDYLTLSNARLALEHWMNKLRSGGKLVLVFTDSLQAAKSYVNRQIDVDKFNILVHGTQEKPFLTKRCCLTIIAVCEVLRNLGMKITKKKLDGTTAIIEAIKE